eukprot:TRINITY_DN19245_c0_g1_i1.p1 TRINITY_DN19245_c0_g1~~TRINITY_DN19245_c0_g1_i1.p1  ORF type:complete len:306 (+),score=29.74 TRINITY_DN19245_c0_g1_i1:181-1098(+)
MDRENSEVANDLNAVCAICFEGLTGTATVRPSSNSPCVHSLHRTCANMYLATAMQSEAGLKHNCPLCRTDWRPHGMLEVDPDGSFVRHFWLVSQELPRSCSPPTSPEPVQRVRGLPCVAAPPTRTAPITSSPHSLSMLPATPASASVQVKSSRLCNSMGGEEIRIRRDYIRPKRGARAGIAFGRGSPLMQRCPLTGALVAPEDASRYLRAALRSGNGRGQASGGGADGREARDCLANFARQRPDLCGTAEDQLVATTAIGSSVDVAVIAGRSPAAKPSSEALPARHVERSGTQRQPKKLRLEIPA